MSVTRFADLGETKEEEEAPLGANDSEDSKSYDNTTRQAKNGRQDSRGSSSGRLKMTLNILEQRLKGLTLELGKMQMRIRKEVVGNFASSASILVQLTKLW